MNHATRVLVVEDEPGIALALYKALREADYQVDTAKSGTSGLRKAAAKKFDIVLLDLGLPDMSGLTICKQLRDDGLKAPIIVLTAESSVRTKVSLFDAGANDYITKPFSVEELQARMRACLREQPKEAAQQRIVVGELILNGATRSVERAGLVIPLRRKEYAILEYLMQHAGTAVTRASLLHHAWNSNDEGWTNTVDVHIKHLRDKVDRPFSSKLIKTVHGVGYKLETSNAIAKIS
ncbi:MAG TPA: response regulator transcription factor [Candidatus Saccharimonadales bacterium]